MTCAPSGENLGRYLTASTLSDSLHIWRKIHGASELFWTGIGDGQGRTTSPSPRDICAATSDSLIARDGCVIDRKSTRLNSSHSQISYAVFCLKKRHKINFPYLFAHSRNTLHIDPPPHVDV